MPRRARSSPPEQHGTKLCGLKQTDRGAATAATARAGRTAAGGANDGGGHPAAVEKLHDSDCVAQGGAKDR